MGQVEWERQRQALRDPQQVLGPTFEEAAIPKEASRFRVEGAFVELLERLQIVLLVTREYENLVVALRAHQGRLKQSYFPVPHPSGLAVDRDAGRVYLAATRNPNYILELCPASRPDQQWAWLTPSRSKIYPGHFYFHDLVHRDGQLYANTVGQNGVIKVNFDQSGPESLYWWPRCVEKPNGQPQTELNYLQLNSIALGERWEDSYLTASCASVSGRRPWHLNYPVDGRGVLFSAATREVVGRGLTRPHSARFHRGKVWVNNSGYGQLGFFQGEHYEVTHQLGSWTRGLAFHPQNVAWVGLSRVLPGYSSYAPGLRNKRQCCGLVAIDTQSGEILGRLTWPQGNQIFGVEWIDQSLAAGFLYQSIQPGKKRHQDLHYRYLIVK